MSPRRSITGNHVLRAPEAPMAFHDPRLTIPIVPAHTLASWTFGRGSVIWRIWPAVLFHTLFAALVVTISLRTRFHLGIPGVLLTVLGVVIGFVISYRAMSGYERYWMGRTVWTDVIRNSRTMGRLVWVHVPLRTKKPSAEGEENETEEEKDKLRVMKEKRLAMNLIEGFSVALKHHIRGELGIYYEDLYPLVKPLHPKHTHTHDHAAHKPPVKKIAPSPEPVPSTSSPIRSTLDPVIPPINAYGTFNPSFPHFHPHHRSSSNSSSRSSTSSQSHRSHSSHTPLLPAFARTNASSRVAGELVPFASFYSWFTSRSKRQSGDPTSPMQDDEEAGGVQRKWRNSECPPADVDGHARENGSATPNGNRKRGRSQTREETVSEHPVAGTHKHRPRVAGGGHGGNVPLDVLRELSKWCAELEARAAQGIVPGSTVGPLMNCINGFEDSLCTLEKILTTPLPFVYSVHIRHTVWIYLFSLPFQLVDNFRWYTIFGVCIASFIYLGFVAAGEEIEQPFGYDENDLDLDLFCRDIIRPDLERIRETTCSNAYLKPSFPPHRLSSPQYKHEHPKSRSHTLVDDDLADSNINNDEIEEERRMAKDAVEREIVGSVGPVS